ncbi:unnamed protein product [Strongylus vulgaris]|uniref:Glutathione S-transferase omega n=1 Tax=Strongylus vulgaris TaxID=40348 RepID=A0A3P7JM00_STRVU|nr:unnamed protein product [Strongylus vulgaris]
MYRIVGCIVFSLWLVPTLVTTEIIGLETKSFRGGDRLGPSSLPLRLFAMRFCPWCERVLLSLARKNMSAEVINVNLSDKPEFLMQRNPEGKVPVLEDRGKIILDSALISEYLDWINPQSSILPMDPYLRAKQRMISNLLEEKVPAAVHAIVEGQRNPSERESAKVAVREALEIAERLLKSAYFGGSSIFNFPLEAFI